MPRGDERSAGEKEARRRKQIIHQDHSTIKDEANERAEDKPKSAALKSFSGTLASPRNGAPGAVVLPERSKHLQRQGHGATAVLTAGGDPVHFTPKASVTVTRRRKQRPQRNYGRRCSAHRWRNCAQNLSRVPQIKQKACAQKHRVCRTFENQLTQSSILETRTESTQSPQLVKKRP